VVGGAIGLESMGVPAPGETTLIVAAIYAATTGNLSIAGVIAAAAAGAIIGDNIGYAVGKRLGHPLLHRYGRRFGLTLPRLRLGQYLFMQHGGKVVFFGRFTAILRAVAALLAGANDMPWRRFMLFNAAGGVIWALVYGIGAYILGSQVRDIERPLGLALLVVGIGALVAGWLFLRHHEAELQARADAALDGDATNGFRIAADRT
jgi:membrane protein DedA with SNARE-associated domain